MLLSDLMPEAELTAAIDAGLVTARQRGDFEIYNYSPAAVYTPGAWDNPVVRMCRGIIANAVTGELVARPWAKFFNHNQPEAGVLDLDAPVEVTDKLDGSLGIIYDAYGEQRVATRGSMESDQAKHATALLQASGYRLDLGVVTPLVEIIYPGNRIVCDYGDRDELVLLGGVRRRSGKYISPSQAALAVQWRGPIVDVLAYRTLADALASAPRAGAEGLCVRFVGENRIVKIKQEDYVRLHRIVTGLSAKSVWRHMIEHGVTEGALGNLLAPLPDEFHDWARSIWDDISRDYYSTLRRTSARYDEIIAVAGEGFSRKDFALRAVEHEDVRSYLFMLLDGRDPGPAILRTLEPIGNRQPRDWEVE